MERRAFLKTVGVTAGAAGVGASALPGEDYDYEVAAQDLPEAGVELLTDEYGVSHVYGEDLYAIGYGQGYVQARDRLFQMDLLRLIGRGESAGAIGPSQVSSDIEVARDLYTDAELEAQWEGVSDENRAMFRGHAAGINRQMAELERKGELPGEFALLGRNPPAWDPVDTVAVVAYFVGFFGVSGGSELGNAETITEMFDRFESEEAAWEAYHDFNRVVVPDNHYGSLLAEEVEETDERALDYDEVPEAQFDAIAAAVDTEPWGVDRDAFDGIQDLFRVSLGAFEGAKFGSNAILVGGEHTDTGSPIVAGGPQTGLLKPSVQHEVGLHGGGFDVVGTGVAGAPGLIVGRTPDFAWTATSSREDMVDTIAVSLHPDDRYRYRWDGEWHEFVTREVVHEPNLWGGLVEGNLSPTRVEQEVAYVEQEGTRMPVVAHNPEENVAFVRRVTNRMLELESALEWLNVGRAESREGFEDALSDFPFGFNFLYADEDDAALYRTGRVPDRATEADPRFPTPAAHHEWADFEAGLDIGGSAVNPERGYAVNWNNAPAPGWREPDDEFEYSGAHRVDILAHRLEEAIVDSAEGVSVGDVEGDPLPVDVAGNLALGDVQQLLETAGVEHPFAPQIVPHLVAAARQSEDEQLEAMADELEAWAGSADLEAFVEPGFERWAETEYSFRPGEDGHYPNGGMAIYEAVLQQLNAVLFEETLGPVAPDLEFDPTAGDALSGAVDPHVADHGPASSSLTLLVNALEGRTSFDWLGDHATRLRGAMADAAEVLQPRYGSDSPAEWRLENRVSEFFPLGGGSVSTIPMSNRPSYARVIGLGADAPPARSVLPPANSGHLNTWEVLKTLITEEPGRLTDQLDLYADFEYKPHPVAREGVEARAVEETNLD